MAQLTGMALLAVLSTAVFGFEVPGLVLLGRLGLLFVTHFLLSQPHATR